MLALRGTGEEDPELTFRFEVGSIGTVGVGLNDGAVSSS